MVEATSLAARVRTLLPLKLLLTAILAPLFCVPYFLIGYFPIRTPITFPLTFVDRLIPPDTRWTLIYQSLYLYIPIAPFLAVHRKDLWRYTSTFTLITLVGMPIFLLFPILCPRASVADSTGFYALLLQYDPPTNAFPSMHIALATLSYLLTLRMLRAERSRFFHLIAALGLLWLLAIAYATLATRQHYAIDLPAGALLAILCFAAAGRLRFCREAA